MARPHKAREAKRDKIFRFCLTADERQKLEELAKEAGLTPSDFARIRTVGGKATIKKATLERQVLIGLQAELNKVGSNVNQIARALNRRSESGTLTGVSMEWVEQTMQQINTLTSIIAKELGYDGYQG